MLYFLLLFCCLWIVIFVGRLAKPEEERGRENIQKAEEKPSSSRQEEETWQEEEPGELQGERHGLILHEG